VNHETLEIHEVLPDGHRIEWEGLTANKKPINANDGTGKKIKLLATKEHNPPSPRLRRGKQGTEVLPDGHHDANRESSTTDEHG
jgi:hypothetical protein